MKQLFLMLALILNISAIAQDDKTVTLLVSGQGKTQDEAKQVALRSAIEQAFGAFISSKTEILNDKLVKDEIVSVTNGNIQKFEIVCEVLLPDGNYSSTLKATVSVVKLTSFFEVRGVEVEFKGSLFALNVKQKILNEQSEISAIDNFISVTDKYIPQCFDYKIQNSEPIAIDIENMNWGIKTKVLAVSNSNMSIVRKIILDNFKNISLSNEQRSEYYSLNKPIYKFQVDSFNFYFRKMETIIKLAALFSKFDITAGKFKITDGNKIDYSECLISNSKNLFKCIGWSFYESYLFGEADHFYFEDSLTFEFVLMRTLEEIGKINAFKVLPNVLSENAFECPKLNRLIIKNPSEERTYHYTNAKYTCGDWDKYFSNRFHPPWIAQEKGISGRQTIAFDIDEKGKIENIRTLSGFEEYPNIQKDILNQCQKLISVTEKCWKSAKCDGIPIRSTFKFQCSIVFR